MKLLVILLLCTGIHTVRCFNGTELLLMAQRAILSGLYNYKSLCVSKQTEVDESFESSRNCTSKLDRSTETDCSVFKNSLFRCSKPLFAAFEECLPDRSKEVPKILLQGFDSAVSHVCKRDGEYLNELNYGCKSKPSDSFNNCERKFFKRLEHFKTMAPTIRDLCELGEFLKVCLNDHLQVVCNNTITREEILGLYEDLLSPCDTVDYTTISRKVPHKLLQSYWRTIVAGVLGGTFPAALLYNEV